MAGANSITITEEANSRFVGRLESTGEGECWNWTGSKNHNGYGSVRFLGKTELSHRVAYMVFKDADILGKVVRHSCDNRACCNPAHLSIGTQLDNVNDMIDRGRKPSKLSNKDVEEIKRMYLDLGIKQSVIAKQFGVHKATISAVITGKNFSRLGVVEENILVVARLRTKHRGGCESHWASKLTNDQVLLFRAEHAKGVSQSEIACRYGINKQTLNKIINRVTWKAI